MLKRILRQKDKKKYRDTENAAPEVANWLTCGGGQPLLEAEQLAIDIELENYFGYHLLEIGICENSQLSKSSPIQHCFNLSPLPGYLQKGALAAHLDAFPIEGESLDLVLLHHVIEYTSTPHQTLKEVSRVLIPRGHAVLVVFNRWSFVGVRKLLLGLFSKTPNRNFQTLSVQRIGDWCKLLDMEPVSIQHVYYGFPTSSALVRKCFSLFESLGQRFGLPFGGTYILTLQKNLSAVTPLKPEWRLASSKLGRLSAVQPVASRVPSSALPRNKNKVIH